MTNSECIHIAQIIGDKIRHHKEAVRSDNKESMRGYLIELKDSIARAKVLGHIPPKLQADIEAGENYLAEIEAQEK